MADEWFYQSSLGIIGPMSSAELKYLVTAGRIDRGSQVRRGPQDAWQRADVAMGLVPRATLAPRVQRPAPVQTPDDTPPTDLLTGLLEPVPASPPAFDKRPAIVAAAIVSVITLVMLFVLLPGARETASIGEIAAPTPNDPIAAPRVSKPLENVRKHDAPIDRAAPTDVKTGAKKSADAPSAAAPSGGAPPPSTKAGDSSGGTHVTFNGETVNLSAAATPAPPSDKPDSTTSASDDQSDGGSATGGAKGVQGSSDFFGITAPATNVAYVVDCSRSMQGEPFTRARDELIRSIGELKQGQKFYVVFFNDRAYPQFFPTAEQRMLTVSNDSRKRIERWIRRSVAEGETDPTDALKFALARRPDAIYLLTDGDFNPAVTDMLVAANSWRIPIHTIAFLNNVGEPLLKKISEQSGGTYRYVSQ